MVLKSSLIATVAIRVAPNLANEIIDQLQDDSFSLRHCSLVSKTWRERALKWLFTAIVMQFTATNPWSYLHWFEEPTPGFHLATLHARELRLVQYPSFMWITPQTLSPILPRFAAFKNVTTLSLHSFSAHHFDDLDTEAVFGHFFLTVRKLDLDEPRTTAKCLLRFLCNFCALDDLSISGPEWDHETDPQPDTEVGTLPPLGGTLHFLRLHADSADFISLLAELPVAFQHVSLVNCQLPSAPINQLLMQLSSNLESLSLSSWFISDCFPGIDLSPCTGVREIQFFAGMVPVEEPLRGIYNSLRTVSSSHVRTIVLDLNAQDSKETFNQEYFRSFRRLDVELHRIADAHQGIGKTVVKLSANNPFALGLCLRRLRRRGKLVLGTRFGEPFGFGEVQWFGA